MAQRPPQRAICLLCEQEKQIYARGGCHGCYRAAQSCGMLDEWLERKEAQVPKPESRIQANMSHAARMNEGRAALSRDAQAVHAVVLEEDGGRVQAVCPCGYASLRFSMEERAATAGAAHQYAMYRQTVR